MENVIEKLEKESTEIVVKVNEWRVINREQYEGLNIFMAGVRKLKKSIKETFDPICKKAKDTHAEACGQRKKHLDPVLTAEKIGNSKMIAWDTEQERLRKEKEDKLRRQAEAEERKKKEALEAQARKQEEKAAALRKQAEEADAKEKAILEEKARLAEEKAEEKREKKEEVFVAPPVLAEPPKLSGVSFRKTWFATVTDEKLIPREYLVPDMKALNKLAGVWKNTKKIPGVMFQEDKGLSRRG